MSFEMKKQAALAELKNSKIWQSNYQPPFLMFMWWLGKEERPPHYNGFLRNALTLGLFFGLFLGLIMWFFVWESGALPAIAAIVASLLAGAIFGLVMACYYSFSAKRNKLSRWEDLLVAEQTNE